MSEETPEPKCDEVRICKVHGPQSLDKYHVYVTKSGRVLYICKECRDNYQRSWVLSNQDYAKEHHRSIRLEVLSHYSPTLSCSICKDSHYEFLALDHVDGTGATHRRNLGSNTVLNDVKRQGFPLGFRVVCHNCNLKYGCRSFWGKGNHVRKLESEMSQKARTVSHRRYVSKHPDLVREQTRSSYIKTKYEVIGYYGGKCSCCELDDLDVLSIDHINGGGSEHRRMLRATGKSFSYRYLKKEGYPLGYQVLCMNCNLAKSLYGYCPHNHKHDIRLQLWPEHSHRERAPQPAQALEW